nr:RhuM family protein [Desulfobulbus alkaliphilus]
MPDKTQSRDVQLYNLDVIISVGYRVKSHQGTQFRIWATQRLKEYIVKGFALNDERFKTGNSMAYFTELQERIREIRLSERFFYQKIKDIYTTSIDYDPRNEKTVEFFKVVQNKLLWAISQQTAAELVYRRADAALPLMGMQSFDKQGELAVRKSDVSISKNYLAEDEMKLLGLLVEQYLAFAEAMAQQRIPMHMTDWIQRLDAIIQLNGRELLTHAGKISHQVAPEKGRQSMTGVTSYVAKGLLPYHGLGSGIKRALEKWPDIDFADDHEGCLFTATVHRKPVEELVLVDKGAIKMQGAPLKASLSDFQMQLLDFIRSNRTVSYDELADMTQKDRTTVMRNIGKLKDAGILRRVGSKKTGHWEVIE